MIGLVKRGTRSSDYGSSSSAKARSLTVADMWATKGAKGLMIVTST